MWTSQCRCSHTICDRITEWFGLEETLEITYSNPTAVDRDTSHQIRLPRAPTNLATSRDGAPTAFLGSLFKCLTNLWVKNFLLTFNLNLPSCSFKPPPCCDSPSTPHWLRCPWVSPQTAVRHSAACGQAAAASRARMLPGWVPRAGAVGHPAEWWTGGVAATGEWLIGPKSHAGAVLSWLNRKSLAEISRTSHMLEVTRWKCLNLVRYIHIMEGKGKKGWEETSGWFFSEGRWKANVAVKTWHSDSFKGVLCYSLLSFLK